MPTIYFVTENYVKTNSPLQSNVDWKQIIPLVKSAATGWIQPTIGTYFFNDLLTKYNAQTLSANETTLVAYIQDVILWYVTADAMLELSFQLKNKGVQSQSGDNSTYSELKAIQFMYDKYKDKAENYMNIMSLWLIENKDLFPNFTNVLNKDATLYHKSKYDKDTGSFKSPIMFI